MNPPTDISTLSVQPSVDSERSAQLITHTASGATQIARVLTRSGSFAPVYALTHLEPKLTEVQPSLAAAQILAAAFLAR